MKEKKNVDIIRKYYCLKTVTDRNVANIVIETLKLSRPETIYYLYCIQKKFHKYYLF